MRRDNLTPTSIAFFSDKLFIIGGRSNGEATAAIRVFDTSRRQMVPTTLNLTEARIKPSSCIHGEIIYVIGGVGNRGQSLKTWERISTVENTYVPFDGSFQANWPFWSRAIG